MDTQINRLLSGLVIIRFRNKNIKVRPFSVEDKAEADLIGQEAYEEAMMDGIFTVPQMNSFMIKNGFWSKEKEDELEAKKKIIEQSKLDYFNNFYKESTKQKIRKCITENQSVLGQLIIDKNLFFDKTCEYIRDYCKTVYLVSKSAFIDGELIGEDVNLFHLVGRYISSSLSEEEIRKVAKSHEWRTLWNLSKNGQNLFTVPIHDLSNEQVSLVSWSGIYCGIYESMDCPSEEIIQDDLALDGWLIGQQRKREDEEKKRAGDTIAKNTNAGEIFVPTQNGNDIKRVHEMNTGYGKNVMASKADDLAKKGKVNETELSHIKLDRQMETNKLMIKGR